MRGAAASPLCRTVAVIPDWIRKLKFFEDTVALGTYQGSIYMVDMNTRKIRSRLDGHTDEISAIDWDGAGCPRLLRCHPKLLPHCPPHKHTLTWFGKVALALVRIHPSKRMGDGWCAGVLCRGCTCDGLPRYIGEGVEKGLSL